jgi:short-subunit dehydrogenase
MELGKVAIITGASRGIGREVAKGLAQDGYNVVLIARTESKLLALADEIKQYGVQSKIVCQDLSHFEEVSKALSIIIKEWGRVDVLVNNAGIFRYGTLETSLDDYQALFDTNVKAQLVLINKTLPVMQKQGSGYIINIASVAGKVGLATIGAYSASKFALVGLSESLYNEYSAQGIKITAICPGYVATEMTKDAQVPQEKMMQPHDILQTIRWLLHLSPTAFVKEVIVNSSPQID